MKEIAVIPGEMNNAERVTKSKEIYQHAFLSSSQMGVLFVCHLPAFHAGVLCQSASTPDTSKAGTQKSLYGSQAS